MEDDDDADLDLVLVTGMFILVIGQEPPFIIVISPVSDKKLTSKHWM